MIFEIPKSKDIEINKWISNHKCKYKNKPTAIGGRYSFIFIPTGIGIFIKVKCICGKELIINDENF